MAVLEIGDRVRYSLDVNAGGGVVIGYPIFSKDRKIVVIADDKYHGMPINERWCMVSKTPDIEKAKRLRKRYVDLYPGFLQEEDNGG